MTGSDEEAYQPEASHLIVTALLCFHPFLIRLPIMLTRLYVKSVLT